MAADLTPDQLMATKKFLQIVNARSRHAHDLRRSMAVRFLFARKFDVERAVALYQQHEATRRREGLADFDPSREPLKSELRTGKFTVLPERDAADAAIAVFTAHKHAPARSTHRTTLQGVVYQLDAALRDPVTQRAGIVFIYDMSNSKFSNFDYDLSQKILTLLKGGYPAKLKKVLIVTAPLWFKAPFGILRLFVREKLRERVYTVSVAQLCTHIPRESLPTQLGGNLALDHDGWLADCLQSMTAREESPPPDEHEQEREQQRPPSSPPPPPPLDADGGGGGWTDEGAPNPPSSSASSGFSDDDSLHGDGAALTFQQLVAHVRAVGHAGLAGEYAEIRARPPDGGFACARLKANLPKNRYTDVLCYDHTRVALAGDDDYIHANFVDGYRQRNAFISTQGPLPKTAADFWRMVWEQHALVIVMTTRVMERSRVKCHQYWMADVGGEAVYDRFVARTVAVDARADYTVTAIELVNADTAETRRVSHWQFTSWPDYGVPDTARALLEFLALVRRQQAEMVAALGDTWAGHPRGPPIVVHCSAGIGRTGTFCTLDICISRYEDVGTVDVRGTVEKIRSQRAYSIQMPDQYVFCHVAFVEYAAAKDRPQAEMLRELAVAVAAADDADAADSD